MPPQPRARPFPCAENSPLIVLSTFLYNEIQVIQKNQAAMGDR